MAVFVRSVLLLVAFMLELVVFVALPAVAFLMPLARGLQVPLAIALFTVLVLFWSRFMAPRASRRLGKAGYITSKAVIYGLACVVIVLYQGGLIGSIFSVATLVDELALMKQRAKKTF